MKYLFLFIFVFILRFVELAQAPEKINYQAIIRNSSNVLVINSPVGMRISIVQGSSSGTVIYQETHVSNTNSNGLVNLEIGSGSVLIGTFSLIDWGNGPYFLMTETDPSGGSSYSISGSSQLLSVPYALYAKTSGSSVQGPAGINGQSAYEIAVSNGYVGTEPQWLTGLQGADGVNGNNGKNALINAINENPGTNCVNGGTKVEYGADDNNDGVLQISEVDGFKYVCNGINGINGTNGANGSNGTNGAGVPTGGTTGQILSKINSTNYNTQWINYIPEYRYLGEYAYGGIIFNTYKDATGVQHGLVVSTFDVSNLPWQSSPSLINANSTWDGLSNSNLNASGEAVSSIQGFLGGTWHLPSIDELAILFNNRYHVNKAIQTSGSGTVLDINFNYWSSTETDVSNAYIYQNGVMSVYPKINNFLVRAVRTF